MIIYIIIEHFTFLNDGKHFIFQLLFTEIEYFSDNLNENIEF